MKVSTELKNLIKEKFEEKKQLERAKIKEKNEKEFKNELNAFSELEVYKNYIDAYNKLNNYLKPLVEEYRYGNNKKPYYYTLCSKDATHFIYKNYLHEEGLEKRLDKERDTLLIKLTYEKDFDSIKNLLSEYGIEL